MLASDKWKQMWTFDCLLSAMEWSTGNCPSSDSFLFSFSGAILLIYCCVVSSSPPHMTLFTLFEASVLSIPINMYFVKWEQKCCVFLKFKGKGFVMWQSEVYHRDILVFKHTYSWSAHINLVLHNDYHVSNLVLRTIPSAVRSAEWGAQL